MIAMEGKSVLSMHTAILCEKCEKRTVNIHQKYASINCMSTHLDIEFAA